MLNFASSSAGPQTKRAVIVVSALLVTLVAITLPFAHRELAEVPPFLPMFGALACGAELVTAYVLFTQVRITRLPALAVLAAGYLAGGLLIVPHLLAFPHLFTVDGLLGGHPQTAVWLWAMWHGGFPLWVFAYLIVQRRFRAEPISGAATLKLIVALAVGAAGFAGLCTLVSVVWIAHLPALVNHGNFSVGFASGVLEAVIVLNAAALVALAAFTRAEGVTQAWLIVAVLAACCDVGLTLAGAGRYTVGWYLARIYSLLSSATILAVFISEINLLYARMEALATIDGLTGVGNRRFFDDRLEAARRDAVRTGAPFALILLDVDWFKKFNDRYGHIAGDACLQRVAAIAKSSLARSIDTIGRYGGEEFGIILPATSLHGASVVAERIRSRIEAERLFVTVSLGCADAPLSKDESPGAVIERADTALYRAKQYGRNRVELAELPEVPDLYSSVRSAL